MQSHHHALVLLARLGYAARGVVNLVVGLLAFLAAMGQGGGNSGNKGALLSLLAHPFGGILLGVVALGLFGFAVWRACQSLLDADRRGTKPKAIGARIGQGDGNGPSDSPGPAGHNRHFSGQHGEHSSF